MNEEIRTSVNLQKRRSSLALSIRITIFFSVVIFYCIFRPNMLDVTGEDFSRKSGRQLLSLIPQAVKKDIENVIKMTNSIEMHLEKSIADGNFTEIKENINHTVINTNLNNSKDDNSLDNIKEEYELIPLDNNNNINCTKPTIYEFPSDGFTREQRQNGWIVVHIFLACYCFWFLAVICDDYFVPAIDIMCSSIKLEANIIGATFMAAAVSSPELFINCIGTFITKTDLGTGTIVGSAVFNILAVPACCGIFTEQIENLDWWPISRDCSMYGFAILCLIGTLYDGKVMWYEALILIVSYCAYIIGMLFNNQLIGKADKLVKKFKFRGSTVCLYKDINEMSPLINRSELSLVEACNYEYIEESNELLSFDLESFAENPWKIQNKSILTFILRWPITFVLWMTTPDCRIHPNLKYLTFTITVCWLAITSYLVSFFITYVGDTLNIPDSVMGLTILAAGMSIPEAISSVLVTNQGHGAMGISNSIGSNTFGILIGLGLPWFVKSYFLPTMPDEYWVNLSSSGLTYSAAALLATLLGFYISFLTNKFYLNWKVGISCTAMYIGFLILASMLELNFFSNINLPVCEH